MAKPQLVQFGNLSQEHFRQQPVWIQCHVVDYDEPWYEDTDEETFRPRTGPLPADPSEGMLLVRASFTLADGTSLPGFLTPALPDETSDGPAILGTIQPQMFLPGGRRESFWDGMFPRGPEARRALYDELQRSPAQVFPIQFRADPGLTGGLADGCVDGFYSRGDFNAPVKVDL